MPGVIPMSEARIDVIAAYRTRIEALLHEAEESDRSRRPITAAKKRQAARLLRLAIVAEEIDPLPTGIVREESDR